jgi:TonB family protein
MRRPLHIAFGLSAFALGLVFAGAAAQLPYAVPAVALAALLLPALWERVRRPDLDAHRLKVAALTLLLWIPVLAFFHALLVPDTSCVVSFEGDYYPDEQASAVGLSSPADEEEVEEPCAPGTSASVNRHANLIWAGVLDKKIVSKAEPFYPPDARAARVSGTVAVAVVVDGDGLVLSARPLSGHPLLRHEAARAACFARFSPALINGPPVRVSGVLTYRFGP